MVTIMLESKIGTEHINLGFPIHWVECQVVSCSFLTVLFFGASTYGTNDKILA